MDDADDASPGSSSGSLPLLRRATTPSRSGAATPLSAGGAHPPATAAPAMHPTAAATRGRGGGAHRTGLFSGGFPHLLASGIYSDLTLVVDGKEYRVHRNIITYASDYFRSLLGGDFRERDAARIELKYEDTTKVFPLFLKYLYEGAIDINEGTVVPLLAMADHFLVEQLRSQCLDYVETKITRDSALPLLKQAIDLGMEDVQDKCLRVIARHFHFLVGSGFSFVPVPIMQRLLQHPMLAVKNEFTVYTAACKYLETRQADGADVSAIFEAVRFPFLTIKQLEKAQQNTLVPRHLIIEGLMVRLKKMENPAEEVALDSIRLTPRESYGLSFIYHHDFDQRGILHYIGTNGGQDPWENPAVCGRIKMTASSIEKGDPAYLADFKEQRECWTKDIPASWFQLDLGPSRKAAVTYYTLRHGGNYKADSLRNWEFKGSHDGQTWVALSRHSGDTALNEPFASKSWAVPSDNPTAYRFFRILQKGHNSSDRNFLALSGIEIYGDLYEANTSYEIPRGTDGVLLATPTSPSQ